MQNVNQVKEAIMQNIEVAITPEAQFESIKDIFTKCTLDQVREIAEYMDVGICDLRLDLNLGMQKMQVCNRIRMHLNKNEADESVKILTAAHRAIVK